MTTSKVAAMVGTAVRHVVPRKWRKDPGDERPCLVCQTKGVVTEGFFIPYLTIWGKSDPQHTGRFVVRVLSTVLCEVHATQDPKEFVPDSAQLDGLRKDLGDEPDLETMVVQYFGNKVCKVDRAMELALEKNGLYEHYYDPSPKDGGSAGIRTRKIS